MAGARQDEHAVKITPAIRDAKGRFRNPDGGPAGQALPRVARMLLEGKGTPWPQNLTNPPQPPPPAQVPAGHAAFTFIGHASFLIRLADGTTILTDPIFSERCSPLSWWGPKRVRPPALALDALPRIDAVLLSHGHYDHLDLPSLRALYARWQPRLLTGLGHSEFLAKNGIPGAVELNWGEGAGLPGGHHATYVPMRHFSARGIRDRARALWGGFAVEAASGGRFIFVGDTAAGGHLDVIGASFGGFGVGLIPIGAYEPTWFMQAVHITPEQAVEAQAQLRVRTAIGMHFGTFKLTQEAIDEPPRRLLAARGAQDFRVPGFGESLMLEI
ncbi:MAG: MBL fold metallo-hydrolase [Roseococcus sp.]|nr:MBL fold metallo-hydrolase [Roseococcus sp.]